jgi:hypothetical protein
MYDLLVALFDEVGRPPLGRRLVVDVHQIGPNPTNFLKEHEREIPPLQIKEIGEIGVAVQDRYDDEAVDILSFQNIDDFLLEGIVPLGRG